MPWFLGLPWTSGSEVVTHLWQGLRLLCWSPEPSDSLPAARKMPKGTILCHKPHRQSAVSQEGHQAKQKQQQRLGKIRDAPENHLKPTGAGHRGLTGHGSCCAWNALVRGNQPAVVGIHTAPGMVWNLPLLCWGRLMHVHPPVSPDTCPVTGDRDGPTAGTAEQL